MKNIQLPQITLDRLLELEVGESGHIIVPTNNKVMAIKELLGEIDYDTIVDFLEREYDILPIRRRL